MHKDAVFSQAALPKKVWELLVQAMDLFEHAKLNPLGAMGIRKCGSTSYVGFGPKCG